MIGRPFGLALCVATVALVPAVQAQDAPAASKPVRITITKVDCSRLVRHMPADDVAFKPGEDVYGRPVAPADLPGSGGAMMPNLVPDVLEIPLNIKPLQDKSYATHGLDDTTMSLGVVRYDIATGVFTLNGEPLLDADQQALAEACAKQGVR